MKTKIQIIFYSMYGHIYELVKEIAKGAELVDQVEVEIFKVPELISDDVLETTGAKAAQQSFAHIPVARVDHLRDADALIFGTPTGGLWVKLALAGKVGSVFASTATQHGGQETTLTSFHSTLFHLGMIVVGVPYAEAGLTNMNEITGGTPYGATTLAGAKGDRHPSQNELIIARYQGKHVAETAQALKLGRQYNKKYLPSS